MNRAKGHCTWIIPDGFIPPDSFGALTSHESICVLNTSDQDAGLQITVFFEDRDPLVNIQVAIPARLTKHVRTASLVADGQHIPIGVPYAMEVISDIPVVVQYSRLDSTQSENALMTTLGFPV